MGGNWGVEFSRLYLETAVLYLLLLYFRYEKFFIPIVVVYNVHVHVHVHVLSQAFETTKLLLLISKSLGYTFKLKPR